MKDIAFLDIDDDEEEDLIENNYLSFYVGNETYAVDIASVTEVVGLQKIAEVPDVPEFIKGVINLRGKVITIMDVRKRFNMPDIEYTERTCIVVLDINNAPTGLIVDGVSEVIEIPEDKVFPPTDWSENDQNDCVIFGIGRVEDKVNIILDVERLVLNKDSKRGED